MAKTTKRYRLCSGQSVPIQADTLLECAIAYYRRKKNAPHLNWWCIDPHDESISEFDLGKEIIKEQMFCEQRSRQLAELIKTPTDMTAEEILDIEA